MLNREPAGSFQPGTYARTTPDKVAIALGESGPRRTYVELESNSRRIAQALYQAGLRVGDHVALIMENIPEFLEVCWGAIRSGLYVTPISTSLGADEATFITNDCGARVLFASAPHARLACDVIARAPRVGQTWLVADDRACDTWGALRRYAELLARYPALPLERETEGQVFCYSSGTTGRPKGILFPLTGDQFGTLGDDESVLGETYGWSQDTILLETAPLYHAGPVFWSLSQHRLGGTVVLMSRFDAEGALQLIQNMRANHGWFVPTMFTRLLNLPEKVRARYDVTSMRAAVHAGAPCPVHVKEQMIDWWGPVIYEFLGATEGGFVSIDSQEWLRHKGSVGRPKDCSVHILDSEGRELASGQDGVIYFEGVPSFEYHNVPGNPKGAFNERGWMSVGDVGHLDNEGFLYVTDRVSDLIISGGVNIYPREVEIVLIDHPAVADVAVIGVPDNDMGEAVKAIVEPSSGCEPSQDLGAELIEYARSRIAHFKCPRTVDFVHEMPRLPTGKIQKHVLRSVFSDGPEASLF